MDDMVSCRRCGNVYPKDTFPRGKTRRGTFTRRWCRRCLLLYWQDRARRVKMKRHLERALPAEAP